mgnify:CR=1 FL=1
MAEHTGAGVSGGQRTALVCDDEEHIVTILRRRLEAAGWIVVGVSNGRDALEACGEHAPDVLILDYQMPGLNGIEVARALAASPETARTAIIMLTGRSHKITPSAIDGTAVREVISKPFSASEVVATAAELTDRDAGVARVAHAAEDRGDNSSVIDEAYESLTLIYRLCGAMSVEAPPESSFRAALRGLREATGFESIAIALLDDPPALGLLAGRVYSHDGRGEDRGPAMELAPASWSALLRRCGHGILPDPPPPLPGGEIIVSPIRVADRAVGLVAAFGGRQGWAASRGSGSSFDAQALDAVARLLGASLENARLHREQERMYIGTLTALSAALEAKDPYTRGHSERVAHLGGGLARAAGLGEGHAARVELAGRLHDIGKIGVPDAILTKPSGLTDEEFDSIKRHPVIGHEMLCSIPALEDVLPAVRGHHERWDGRGYPDRIAGREIDRYARMLALADTFDAMSSNRSYRGRMTRDEVLGEIEANRGTQFDPDLADLFLNLDFSGFDELHERYAESARSGRRAA